jgi:uncharacterized membrane protein
MLSGAAAMIFRKGSRLHAQAGKIFAISMLTLSASGVYIGFTKSQTTNMIMGVLTFYLVATAWAAARRPDVKNSRQTGRQTSRQTSLFDWGALLLALVFGVGLMTYGIEALRSPTGLKDGYPATLYFVFGPIALLAAAGDIRMLVRGGVFGSQRIARHLWRMCLGMFIAAASFFLGQQRVFPASWRGSPAFYLPPLGILIFMIFWLLRVSFTNAYNRTRSPFPIPEDRAELQQQSLPG